VQYRAIGSLLAQAGIAAPPAAARRAARLGERLTGAGRCLIMGDLWPDSVLVQGRRLRLIDWELAHFGQPAQDVGHLLAHLWMHAHWGAAQSVPLARSFLKHYVDALGDRARSLADARFRADCAVHEGAEIIARCLGPFRQGYAGLPATSAPVREAVAFAIDCIMAGDDPLIAAALT
jgi:aminoglycoside phosphotransferase (APT) family kinase protein